MAIFAHIKNGVVVNVLVAETINDAKIATDNATCVEIVDGIGGIGWAYDGTSLIAPTIEGTDNNA